MASPLSPEASLATNKSASLPSIGSSSKQPAPSTSLISNDRVTTAVMMAPNLNTTIEASGTGALLATSPARVLPKQVLSSEDNNHDDSDSAYSNFSTTHTVVDTDENSDSNSASVKGTNSNAALLRSKAKMPKKTLGKRVHADSNAGSASSNAAAVVPAKKHVQTNASIRAEPPVAHPAIPAAEAGKPGFLNFTGDTFTIQLGQGGQVYRTHESPLMRSPKLAAEIQKARANRSDSKKTHLSLMAHDRNAFNQMLHYLYYDSFTLTKDPTSVEYLDEIKELMSLAKHYVLPGLQKQVVKLFTSSKLMEVMTLSEFFDWAEDMYFEEIDHENGPFKVYFSKVAPALMKKVDEGTKKELSRMIKHGGGFANELFLAVFTALDMQTEYMAVKKEESTPARRLTFPAKAKGPVGRTAHEAALGVPGDESMEDGEHLFIRK